MSARSAIAWPGATALDRGDLVVLTPVRGCDCAVLRPRVSRSVRGWTVPGTGGNAGASRSPAAARPGRRRRGGVLGSGGQRRRSAVASETANRRAWRIVSDSGLSRDRVAGCAGACLSSRDRARGGSCGREKAGDTVRGESTSNHPCAETACRSVASLPSQTAWFDGLTTNDVPGSASPGDRASRRRSVDRRTCTTTTLDPYARPRPASAPAVVSRRHLAGFIDAIAGGGMVTIPAMLLAGIPPLQVLGTSKLQSLFGSGSSTGLCAARARGSPGPVADGADRRTGRGRWRRCCTLAWLKWALLQVTPSST